MSASGLEGPQSRQGRFVLPKSTSVHPSSRQQAKMALSDDDKRAAVALADSDLQLVLQEAGASLDTQHKVVQVHTTRRRFQAIADSRAEARLAAEKDIGLDKNTIEGRAQIAAIVVAWEAARDYDQKEHELRAEARILGQRRVLQVQERQAMLRAVTLVHGKLNESETPSNEYLSAKAEQCESNEPLAAALDMISSRKDQQVEAIQSTVDPTGLVRVTKTLAKQEMPHNSEAYRRVLKLEGFAWLCMAARYKAKPFLQGLKLESFTKFVDFILGDKVANLRMPSSNGKEQFPPRPPWTIVLAFEYKLRTEAMRMVVEDGETIAGALEKVVKDPSLKETYFTTPLALHAAEQPSKYRKGGGKLKGNGPLPPAPYKGAGTKPNGPKGRGKGGKQFAHHKLVAMTPDGKQICFAYNAQGCKDKGCARVHCCRVAGCFGEHPAHQQPGS